MITPNFEETCFEGQISMSGRIFGICFAVWALQILFDKKTIPAIKRVTHKGVKETMAENNNFESTVQALFKGMDSFISTKTVVGEGDSCR